MDVLNPAGLSVSSTDGSGKSHLVILTLKHKVRRKMLDVKKCEDTDIGDVNGPKLKYTQTMKFKLLHLKNKLSVIMKSKC